MYQVQYKLNKLKMYVCLYDIVLLYGAFFSFDTHCIIFYLFFFH